MGNDDLLLTHILMVKHQDKFWTAELLGYAIVQFSDFDTYKPHTFLPLLHFAFNLGFAVKVRRILEIISIKV